MRKLRSHKDPDALRSARTECGLRHILFYLCAANEQTVRSGKAVLIAVLAAHTLLPMPAFASISDSETRRPVRDSRSVDWQQDIEEMTSRIEKNTKDAEAYCERGDAFSHIGQYQSAFPDFDKAITINANYARAYFLRANAYRFLGDENSAIEDYSSAVKLDPNMTDAYSNRALCYRRLGVHAEYKKDMKMARKVAHDAASKAEN